MVPQSDYKFMILFIFLMIDGAYSFNILAPVFHCENYHIGIYTQDIGVYYGWHNFHTCFERYYIWYRTNAFRLLFVPIYFVPPES